MKKMIFTSVMVLACAVLAAPADALRACDKNGDGSIDAVELKEALVFDASYARFDSNSDGMIDTTEFSAALTSLEAERPQEVEDDKKGKKEKKPKKKKKEKKAKEA